MDVVITSDELKKALAEIEAAEKNGFMYCLAVLKITSAGPMLDQCRVAFSDIIEKAHPTDRKLDWGRFQDVSRHYKFKHGQLVPQKRVVKGK